MSKPGAIVMIALIFVFQIVGAAAQQLGAPGEPRGQGTTVLRAAQIIDGTNGHEFTLMVEWGGMRPLDSIVAGTLSAAKLLGLDKNIGSLAAGKYADIVAVSGDPLKDIRRMEQTVFVMKNGAIYKETK